MKVVGGQRTNLTKNYRSDSTDSGKDSSTDTENLIFDTENIIPEYFDETHFASPDLYVFWSLHLFNLMDLQVTLRV